MIRELSPSSPASWAIRSRVQADLDGTAEVGVSSGGRGRKRTSSSSERTTLKRPLTNTPSREAAGRPGEPGSTA